MLKYFLTLLLYCVFNKIVTLHVINLCLVINSGVINQDICRAAIARDSHCMPLWHCQLLLSAASCSVTHDDQIFA